GCQPPVPRGARVLFSTIASSAPSVWIFTRPPLTLTLTLAGLTSAPRASGAGVSPLGAVARAVPVVSAPRLAAVSTISLRVVILMRTSSGVGDGVLDCLDQLQPAPKRARLAAWSVHGTAERFRARL